MPNSCIIHRDNRGRIDRVSAPGGGRSELFDHLAGMAAVGNVERAAKAMMTVYGERFRERFGDWTKGPMAREALRRLRFRFIGEKAAANLSSSDDVRDKFLFRNLTYAEDMESQGYDVDAIWRATGWRRGGDGKWRYELPDYNLTLTRTNDELRALSGDLEVSFDALVDLTSYEELRAMYPSASRLTVSLRDNMDGEGSYSPITYTIFINKKTDDFRNVLLHELQHFIQQEEGFDSGASMEAFDSHPEVVPLGMRLNKSLDERRKAWDSRDYDRARERRDEYLSLYNPINYRKYTEESSRKLREYYRLDREMDSVFHEMSYLEDKFSPTAEDGKRLGDLMDRYRDISQRMSSLRDDLEYEREMTSDEIHDLNKVVMAYDSAMDAISAKLSPLANRIIDQRRALDEKRLDLYRRSGGEVEGRNVQARKDMKPEELYKTPWWEASPTGTMDVEPSMVIYMSIGSRGVSKLQTVDDTASSLGITANSVTRRDIEDTVEDEELKQAMLDSKGWYDPATDEITVVLDNNIDEADVQATVLHEAISHKGLRGLLGDRFGETMDQVFDSMDTSSQEAYMARYGDRRTAAEEWLADIAENDPNETILQRIVAIIRDALRALGVNLRMNDADIADLLRRSRENLTDIDSTLKKMNDTSSENGRLTYGSGEPRLFYRSDRGRTFDSLTSAAGDSSAGKVSVGFLAGSTEEAVSPTGEADITFSGGSVSVNNEEAFVPVMEVDTRADLSTRGGTVNYLVKKGLLSGERENVNGTYCLTGAGNTPGLRIFNAIQANAFLKSRFGDRESEINDIGSIDFDTDRTDDVITLRTRDGHEVRMDRRTLLSELRQGRFEELNDRFEFFEDVVVGLMLETDRTVPGNLDRKIAEDAKKEDLKNRTRLLDILSSLGIRVMGMEEYLESYRMRNGVEPSARALSDMANRVIALAEGATVEDLVEEAAHFLVDTYRNQEEVSDVLPTVRESEEWSAYAPLYYEIYGKRYSGAELDRMVEREILGKILARKFVSGMERRVDELEASGDSQLSLLGRIIRAIRNFFTNQRQSYNEVLDSIEKSVLSDDPSMFDTALLNDSDHLMYSAEDKEVANQLLRHKRTLDKLLRSLRNMKFGNTANVRESVSRLNRIDDRIKEVGDRIEKNDVVMALHSIIATAKAQVEFMRTVTLEKARKGEEIGFDNEQVFDAVYSNVVPLIRNLRGYVNNQMRSKYLDKAQFIRDMDSILATAERTMSDVNSLRSSGGDKFWENLLGRMGINKVYHKRIIDEVNNVKKDISAMTRFFGTLEHSSNPILRVLGRVLAMARQRGREAGLRAISSMTRRVADTGWRAADSEGLIQDVVGPDGKVRKSVFIESARDMARYDMAMRTEQANAIIDSLGLETLESDGKRVFDMTRDEMVCKLLSDEGLMVPVDMVDGYDDSGKVITRRVQHRVKATGDSFSPSFMTLAQQDAYHDRMNRWFEENDERPMLKEYYDKIDEVWAKVREKIGREESRETRDLLARLRSDRYNIMRPFRGPDGKVDMRRLLADPVASRNLSDLRRDRAIAKSFQYADGTDKQEGSPDFNVAEELTAYDEAYREVFGDSRKGERASDAFIDRLRELDGDGQRAWNFLMENASVDTSSEAFDSQPYDDALWEAIQDNRGLLQGSTGDRSYRSAENAYNRIMRNKARIRALMRWYRDYSNFGECDFDALDGTPTMSEVNRLYDEIAELRRTLRRVAIAAQVDVEGIPFGMEGRTTRSFMEAIGNMGGKESTALDFVRRYIPARYLADVESFRVRLGMEDTDLSKEEKEIVKVVTGNSGAKPGQLTEEQIAAATWRYALSMTYPYTRRMFPAGYDSFVSAIMRGDIKVWEVVMDARDGISAEDSVDKYGFDINLLDIRVGEEWLETSDENDMTNPGYDPTLGYGRHIPRMDKYRNDAFFEKYGLDSETGEATRNTGQWAMRREFLDIARGALEAYDESSRSVYMIPQISKAGVERLSKATGGVSDAAEMARNVVRDWTGERLDDPIHGQMADMGVVSDEDDIYRVIPKYYISRLENESDVSHDLAYSYSMYALQAAMYREKRAAMSEVQGLRNRMLETEYGNGKAPETTHAYKMFKDWVNAVMYDVRVNNRSLEWNVGNHKVNVNKLALMWTRLVSVTNLGFSPAVALTSAVTGQANFLLENLVGQYIPKGSTSYAYRESQRQMSNYVSEIGEINRENKLYVIGENMGIFNVRNRVRSAGYNRIWRTMFRDLPFKMLEVLNSPLNPQIIVAVMDDLRLYNGEFMNHDTYREVRMSENKNLTEEAIQREWEAMRDRSLWNSVEIRDGGVHARDASLQEAVSKGMLEASMRARSLSQICEGGLNEENRVGASRNAFWNMILPHRGWFIIAAQRRFKKGGFNYQTMRFEEGYDRTLVKLIVNAFNATRQGRLAEGFSVLREEYDKLGDHERNNIRRAVIDLGMFLLFAVIGRALMGYRDDHEDDWFAQFSTYIGFRFINEMASQTSPFLELNAVDMVQEPFVTARKMADLVKIWEWNPFETVETGVYKGESKAWRSLMKFTFGKQWYNIKTARDVRQTSDYWRLMNPMTVNVFLGGGSDE